MKLYIKNMVCPRCIMAVSNILTNMNLSYLDVKLGEVLLEKELTLNEQSTLRKELETLGFELINNSQQQIIEQIKSIIINYVHYNKDENLNLSDILSSKLYYDYSYLSKLFSSNEGVTIEHYLILQKIEKVKELISYNQHTISEIALEMKYSSVAHLSAQFKKITGMTPSQFKSQETSQRKGLDSINQ